MHKRLFVFAFFLSAPFFDLKAQASVPARVVVLTFDDAIASHSRLVRPILKQYGFGATFFPLENIEPYLPQKKNNNL